MCYLQINVANFLKLDCNLVPNQSSSGDLKRMCETDLGLVSQCCLRKYVLKISRQYLANVSLKINVKVCAKKIIKLWTQGALHYIFFHFFNIEFWALLFQMGGRNTVLLSWSIPLVSDIPTIIFGADVTHPETERTWVLRLLLYDMKNLCFLKGNGCVQLLCSHLLLLYRL